MKVLSFLVFIPALCQNGLVFCIDDSNASVTDLNEPLLLTPLIRGGEFATAKRLSNVEPFPGFNFTSHSGYLTMERCYSNIFFWFLRAQNNPESAPVILWLTGGPGISSLYALFGENGPFSTDSNLTLHAREYNWISDYNVIYVDSPVGAGFSYTNDTSCYARNASQVASDLVDFLDQFFTLFWEFMYNDFYIAGKSYSGTIAVSLALELYGGNITGNFKGLISVCGYFDPIMLLKTDHMYNVGFLNEQQKKFGKEQEALMMKLFMNGSFQQAMRVYGILDNTLQNMTGMIEFSNFLFTELPGVFSDYEQLISQNYFREKIHAGNITFDKQDIVLTFLSDIGASSKQGLEYLLNNFDIKVLLLSGQLDLIINPPSQRQFVTSLNWTGAADYNQTERFVWKVDPSDDEVAGYSMQVGKFVEVMVRDGGHMLSYDQPRATLDAVNKFIRGQTFA